MCLIDGMFSYFGKKYEFNDILDGLISELKELPDDNSNLNKVIPLIWAGGRGQNSGILEIIDNSNASILGITTPVGKLYREDVPPLESLARYVLDGQTAGGTIFYRNAIEKQVNEIGAKGLICYNFIGCSLEVISREMNKEYFQQKGIPCINLEGGFQPDLASGQTLTRVKAFIEMLSENCNS